jgi:uncharacterized protein YbdZ (MbtH family)
MIDRIEDRELRLEVRTILGKLETLSDGRAASTERSARSSETPLGPPEFANLSEADCPPADRSLFDHFRWRFDRAIASGASTKRIYFLLWEAEKAYQTRTVPPDPDNPRTALILNRADEEALKRKVCADYEGQHSYRVHLELDLPQGWVERVREEDGREPETGYRRPKWRELTDEDKVALVQRFRGAGKTQEETARWLGVSRRTVIVWDRAA